MCKSPKQVINFTGEKLCITLCCAKLAHWYCELIKLNLICTLSRNLILKFTSENCIQAINPGQCALNSYFKMYQARYTSYIGTKCVFLTSCTILSQNTALWQFHDISHYISTFTIIILKINRDFKSSILAVSDCVEHHNMIDRWKRFICRFW